MGRFFKIWFDEIKISSKNAYPFRKSQYAKIDLFWCGDTLLREQNFLQGKEFFLKILISINYVEGKIR